ncbi:FMN-binding protein MioC [Shewanella salipaludis]|uniref:FMN-binding protein MioC n=1 Tax=Shewanella salipaludis TaxID=2723052 RepID=A0A972JMS3_9GAMM|nr:FMN-binding protein MioC [Shewanella salipaludis]NMH66802.1 FMN-binding protein MioC [Shewanella salipaludis]
MAKIDILVGTTLGSAEYVADEMAAELTNAGHHVVVHLAAELSELDREALWLIVSSTHGAGDLPDNIQPFCDELTTKAVDLSGLKFALCAIGDSSYDTFCQGPDKLIAALEHCGAKSYVDKIQIDVQYDPIPEEPALTWLAGWQNDLQP